MSIFCSAELEQLKDPVFFKIRYVKDLVNRMPVETIETPEALVMFVKVTCDDWIGWIYILMEFKFRYTNSIFTYFLLNFTKGQLRYYVNKFKYNDQKIFSFLKRTINENQDVELSNSICQNFLHQVKDKIVWF